jgi:aryl-alcohol dehydrogenase-like predicted oxidoreductase
VQKRKLGWTDLELTVMGMGSYALGGGDWAFSWGPQDDEDSIAAYHRAVELGINWIDTAAAYGLGHAEEVLARALKEMSPKPMVATKCGLVWNQQGEISKAFTKESVQTEVEASLKRLGVEVIDLYHVHWPPVPDDGMEEGWGAMADLVKAGKVRYIGVSNFDIGQMKRIQPIHPIASLQPPYSMLRREVEDELLSFCAQNDIGVITYSPMQEGMLSGKMTRERVENLPESDHRRGDPFFQEPRLSQNLDLVEGLREVAEKAGRSVAQLAIAWVLRRPEVTAAIVGARRPDQIEGTAPAADWELSEAQIAAVDALLARYGAV